MAELKCHCQSGSSGLPSFPVFHLWPFLPRIQYQGQRMSLALSLPQYLRTSGSEPGVPHRVSPSFQLNRLSEYPGLLRDSPLLPTWFCSLEPPNKLAVPKWIGFHCDRLVRSLHLHLDQVTAIQSAWWHLHGPQVPNGGHRCPASWKGAPSYRALQRLAQLSQVPAASPRGGQTIYKKDRASPLVRCLVPARPVGILPRSVCLGLPIHSLAVL